MENRENTSEDNFFSLNLNLIRFPFFKFRFRVFALKWLASCDCDWIADCRGLAETARTP